MSQGVELQRAIQDLRAREFTDLPEDLVEQILQIEASSVEDREAAQTAVRTLIMEEARRRAAGDAEGDQ